MTDTTQIGLSVSGASDIKRLEDRIESLTKSLGQQILKTQSLEKTSTSLGKSYKTTSTLAEKSKSTHDKVTTSVSKEATELTKLQAKYKEQSLLLTAMNKNYSALDSRLRATESSLNGYKGKLTQVVNSHGSYNTSGRKSIDTARQLEGAFRGAAGGVGKLWLAYGALLPMMAGFGAATLTKEINELGSSFEYMTKYSSSLSDHSVSLDKIRTSLLEIKGVAKTPTELADGYLELIKAGVSAKDALDQVGTAAKYATVGEMGLGSATQQLVTITKAFEKSSKGANGQLLTVADTADIVAYAAQKSTASFGDMQTAFTYMTSLASIANMTLQESAAALMIMHDAGLKGSLGATSLRTAITRLINPNEAARVAFNGLGGQISAIFDDDGNIKGIQSMMAELKRLKETVSAKEWSEFSFKAFGLRGMNVNVMVDELATLDSNLKDIGESVGFVDRVFSDVSETTQITAENLKNSFEKALITAFNGEKATGILTNLDELISSDSFQSGMINLADGMYSVAEAAIYLAPWLEPITISLGFLADRSRDAALGWKGLAAAIKDDPLELAKLSAEYQNTTLSEAETYNILESEIGKTKRSIYELNKLGGLDFELEKQIAYLNELEAKFNKIEEAARNSAVKGYTSTMYPVGATSYDTFQSPASSSETGLKTTGDNINSSLDSFFGEMDKSSNKEQTLAEYADTLSIMQKAEEKQQKLDEKAEARAEKKVQAAIARAEKQYAKEDALAKKNADKLTKYKAKFAEDSAKIEKDINKVKLDGLELALANIKTEYTARTNALDTSLEQMESFGATDAELKAAEESRITALTAWKKSALEDAKDIALEEHGIITDYRKLTEDTLLNSYQVTVDAFARGESVKQALATVSENVISELAVSAATTGLAVILEALGIKVGAWAATGAAEASTFGDSLPAKLASGAAYLAGAGALIYGGKELGESVFAQGGWLGSNPNGGMLTGGSGTKDDLFLGYTDGGHTRNWGMGGEFVVNKKQTEKYYPVIKAINDDKFAGGGMTSASSNLNVPVMGDDKLWDNTRSVNDGGFDTFWDAVIRSGGNFYQAIGESIAYYAGVGGGMVAGKVLGPDIFKAEGGMVADRKFGFGGFFSDILDPGGIFHETETFVGDAFSSINEWSDKLNPLSDIVGAGSVNWGGVWDYMRDLPIVGDTVKRADSILFPFMRDAATPDRSINADTMTDTIDATYRGLAGELEKALVEAIAMFTVMDPVTGTLYGTGIIDGVEDMFNPFGIFKDGGRLPMYADGGYISAGSFGIAGETGPEIITGPANVTSAKDTAKLLNQKQEITIPIYIGDEYLTTTIVTIADKQITMRQQQGNPRGVTRI